MRVLFLAVLLFASSLAAQTPPQNDVPAGNVETGRRTYNIVGCYQCHGYEAQGPPRLAPRPLAYQAFSRYVRRPVGVMPPYTPKVLSDQQIADIYAFLRTVAEPPAMESIPILSGK
jgi:mono/diheme cytochrome c family protein